MDQSSKELHADIQDSDQRIINDLSYIDSCLKAVDALKCAEIIKLKQYRDDILKHIDTREKELQEEIEEIHAKDITQLQALLEKMKSCQAEINNIRANLKAHEQNASEFLIAAIRTIDELAQLQTSVIDIHEQIGYQQHSVLPNKSLENTLSDMSGFATVEMIEGNETLCYGH